MCGIVGILDRSGPSSIDRRLLAEMNDSLVHRGPDGKGLFVGPGVGLGHRRLSIIDLAGGHQPLFNEDRSVVVVYNGEIFNFRELTKTLRDAGHHFRTSSDTEVIVHAWEEWGESCVQRFRGQFAFAIWDIRQRTLFLARDRLGIKPLYYAELADGMVVFGSELKALLRHPRLPREIDPQAVEDYFCYGYVPDPKSIYRSVKKLPPGHTLRVRQGMPREEPKEYWDVSFDCDAPGDLGGMQEELVRRLREAVSIRLISDVPLGAFLSGGIDSSAVVAMMTESSENRVDTCSIGFSHPDYDESEFAAEVSKRYGTRHHSRQVDPDAFDLVDRLARIYDEPYADSSAIPTYRVCALARERVTVALSGDGGDEVFAGYRRYRWHHYEELLRSRLPDGPRHLLFKALGSVYPKLDWAPRPLRAKTTLEALARGSVDAYFHSVSFISDEIRQRLYSKSFQSDLQGYRGVEVLRKHMQDAPAEHHLARVQYADLKTYLPGDILTKVDRASMANSLEVRVPFLDHHLVEWAAKLPRESLMQGRQGKYVLKTAMEPYLSKELLYREKMGFAVPLATWFRGPLRERVRALSSASTLSDSGMFDMDYITTMIEQHQSGLRDNSSGIWSLVMFESFLREAVDGDRPSPAEPYDAMLVSAVG